MSNNASKAPPPNHLSPTFYALYIMTRDENNINLFIVINMQV